MPRILFTDLDGTLLTTDKQISPGNLSAINEMIEKGHRFVFSTGRPLSSVLKLADAYGFNKPGIFISCYNGGLIYDCGTKKELLRNPLKKEQARIILDTAHSLNVHAHTYSDTEVISERETEELKFYSSRIKVPYIIVPDSVKYLNCNPIKVIAISRDNLEILDVLRNKIQEIFNNTVYTVYSSSVILEFANPNANKGYGLIHLCQLLNIPVSDAIAAGDEENDLTMLQAAGIGVAMKNGKDLIKEAADYVTQKDNDSDGIAEVIYKFIL